MVCETLKTFEVRLRQNGFSILVEGADTPAAAGPHRRGRHRPVALQPARQRGQVLERHTRTSPSRCGREGGFVVISVRDQGIGIPRDEQAKIFDRFHRVGTGLVHDVKGSGLGLSIVQPHRARRTAAR